MRISDWSSDVCSSDLVDYAAPIEGGVGGSWGVNDVVYALMMELGGVIKPVNAKALAIPQPGGGVVFAQSVTIPAYPYLRPAADETYPTLGRRIQRAYDKDRSEEHTSELQSLMRSSYAVFCLKKKRQLQHKPH